MIIIVRVGGGLSSVLVQAGVFVAGRLMNSVWKVSAMKDALLERRAAPATQFGLPGAVWV